jgi:hypothetical protein
MSVTRSALNFKDSFLNSQNGDLKKVKKIVLKKTYIQSTTAKIENQDVALSSMLLVQSIGNCCGSRLIDDSQNVQSGNGSSILGSLSLRIVEVSRPKIEL